MLLTFFGKYREKVPLILRFMLGLTFLLSHGLPKLTNSERWEGEGRAMANLGITFAPYFWGFMAGATETLAGILLLVGLAVRPSALVMLFVMMVAALNSLVNQGNLLGGRAHPVDAAAGLIALLILGAGTYSLDRKFGLDK